MSFETKESAKNTAEIQLASMRYLATKMWPDNAYKHPINID